MRSLGRRGCELIDVLLRPRVPPLSRSVVIREADEANVGGRVVAGDAEAVSSAMLEARQEDRPQDKMQADYPSPALTPPTLAKQTATGPDVDSATVFGQSRGVSDSVMTDSQSLEPAPPASLQLDTVAPVLPPSALADSRSESVSKSALHPSSAPTSALTEPSESELQSRADALALHNMIAVNVETAADLNIPLSPSQIAANEERNEESYSPMHVDGEESDSDGPMPKIILTSDEEDEAEEDAAESSNFVSLPDQQ